MSDKPKAVIIDIDGTLADSRHRYPLIANPENIKQWDAWVKATPDDVPYEWCVDLMKGMKKIGIQIIFVTGRSETSRKPTVDWLSNKVPGFEDCLMYMRPVGDKREDYVIKEQFYQEVLSKQFEIVFAVDDKDSVVDMWRNNNVTCLHCAKWTAAEEEAASRLNTPDSDKKD